MKHHILLVCQAEGSKSVYGRHGFEDGCLIASLLAGIHPPGLNKAVENSQSLPKSFRTRRKNKVLPPIEKLSIVRLVRHPQILVDPFSHPICNPAVAGSILLVPEMVRNPGKNLQSLIMDTFMRLLMEALV